MADLNPDEDTAPPADPFEGELVAYLDGELDVAAARKVEARLATDPQARSRATALKKTFELLDYLPKPEPSAAFTSRTLDKIPALQPVTPQQQPQPSTPQTQPKPSRTKAASAPVESPRPSIPAFSKSPSALKYLNEPNHSKRWMWAVGILAALTGFAAAGYIGGSAFRSNTTTLQTSSQNDAVEELSLADRRVLENLALYTVVDDFEFVNELAKPEYFGDDPTVSFDTSLKMPTIQREVNPDFTTANHEKVFKQLSPERQQTIRKLDKDIQSTPPHLKDRLIRVLEGYVAWFFTLSVEEKRRILTAANSKLRLEQIREIQDRQWVESLAANQRKQYEMAATESLKRKLVEEWKGEEIKRRKEWVYARKNPSETLEVSKIPPPFDNEKVRAEILAFARHAFRIEDNKDAKGSRLSANELERYNSALNFALTQGGAAWQIYGKTVYELAKKQEDYLLPPPAESKLRFTEFSDLPTGYLQHALIAQGLKKKASPFVGKWPEFPLEIHKDVMQKDQFFVKGWNPRLLPQLGPVKMADFTPAVRSFMESDLLLKLTEAEKKNLAKEEGRWPEYPREVVRLARWHDLSIPGVMLPGSQKQWEANFGASRSK